MKKLGIWMASKQGATANAGVMIPSHRLKPYLARLIQNGFTGEAKAGETRKTGFSWLLVHFNSGLQNGFTLQCLDLRKINEAKTGISHAKEALRVRTLN